MTETDATKRPLEMPERFIPYLEKHRIYKVFKDMIRELVLDLPRDHLKHMKLFLGRHAHGYQDTDKVIILVSPEIKIDIKRIVKDLIKDLGFFVITRRCILDRYEKHDEFVPGCISPALMSAVTKSLTVKDPVLQAGWLMFDHPCTVREARCLQQDGVLPTVTLVLIPPPAQAPPAHDARTPGRSFFQQDFEGLKFAYKATVKEVYIDPEEEPYAISTKCFNAIRASASGAQGARQGHLVVGAPGVYRVLLVGPRGSGRSTQAVALAKHFGLVYLHYDDLYNEAMMRTDEIATRLREYGPSVQIKAEIVRRRLLKKDCIDHGWVLVGYPTSEVDFENLDKMTTPPNRVIFLNAESGTCRARVLARHVDACTGRPVAADAPRARRHPRDHEQQIDDDLDNYFSECLAELRAAAGITAVEIDAQESIDQVQVKVQAAVIAAPSFNIEYCSQLRNVRGE